MITDRFVRNIWAVNGVIFLGVFVLVFIAAAITYISDLMETSEPETVITGEKLEKAKEQGLALQGISYDTPMPLYGSDLTILTISPKTFEEPKQYRSKGFDLSQRYALAEDVFSVVNVLFLDSRMNVVNTLTHEKLFIKAMKYPSSMGEYYSDTVQRHITYNIAMADTDKNGSIDFNDDDDLFISGLDGTKLLQITKGVDVVDHSFLNRDQILIRYKKRSDVPDEHKRIFFALYSITENKLDDLTSLEKALDNVEQILIK